MKLLSGNSNKPLSKQIAKFLKSKLVNSSIRKFSDGEIYLKLMKILEETVYSLFSSIFITSK